MDEWSSSTGILDTINPSIEKSEAKEESQEKHKRDVEARFRERFRKRNRPNVNVIVTEEDPWYSLSNLYFKICMVMLYILDIFEHPGKYFATQRGFIFSSSIFAMLFLSSRYYAHKMEISTIESEPVIGKFHNISYCWGYGLSCSARYDYITDGVVNSQYIYGLNCYKIQMLSDTQTVHNTDDDATCYLSSINCNDDKIDLSVNYICHTEDDVFYRQKKFYRNNIGDFTRHSLFHYLPDDITQEGIKIYPYLMRAYILKILTYILMLGYLWLTIWKFIDEYDLNSLNIFNVFDVFDVFDVFGDYDGQFISVTNNYPASSEQTTASDDVFYESMPYIHDHLKLD
jgi:hypothetical protein